MIWITITLKFIVFSRADAIPQYEQKVLRLYIRYWAWDFLGMDISSHLFPPWLRQPYWWYVCGTAMYTDMDQGRKLQARGEIIKPRWKLQYSASCIEMGFGSIISHGTLSICLFSEAALRWKVSTDFIFQNYQCWNIYKIYIFYADSTQCWNIYKIYIFYADSTRFAQSKSNILSGVKHQNQVCFGRMPAVNILHWYVYVTLKVVQLAQSKVGSILLPYTISK